MLLNHRIKKVLQVSILEKVNIISCSESTLTGIIFLVPREGTFVSKYQVKSAGPYLLGPTFGFSPVSSIVQCLARKKETDKFFTLKVRFKGNILLDL